MVGGRRVVGLGDVVVVDGESGVVVERYVLEGGMEAG